MSSVIFTDADANNIKLLFASAKLICIRKAYLHPGSEKLIRSIQSNPIPFQGTKIEGFRVPNTVFPKFSACGGLKSQLIQISLDFCHTITVTKLGPSTSAVSGTQEVTAEEPRVAAVIRSRERFNSLGHD